MDSEGSDVFDIPTEARMRGLDEHELMHMVFECGEEEGIRMMEELSWRSGAGAEDVFGLGRAVTRQ